MKTSKSAAFLSLTACCLAFSSGCGKKLTEVTGTVKYRGEPVQIAKVTLMDAKGVGKEGSVSNGKLTVKDVAPGEYTVMITTKPFEDQLNEFKQTEQKFFPEARPKDTSLLELMKKTDEHAFDPSKLPQHQKELFRDRSQMKDKWEKYAKNIEETQKNLAQPIPPKFGTDKSGVTIKVTADGTPVEIELKD